MNILAAAFLVGLSASRAAAAPATVSFEVDARVELLSVVVMLSDPADFRSRRPAGLDAYASSAEAAFSRFSGHPAVARVSGLRKAGASASALARAVLAPPAGDPLQDDLRDFEKASRFAEFFAAHRKEHEAFAETARRESLRAISPEDALAYMGLPFAGEHRFVLAPLLPDEAGAPEPGVRPGSPARGAIAFRFDTLEGSVAAELCRAAVNWVRAPSGAIAAHIAAAVGLRVLARDMGEPAYAAALSRASGRLPHLEAVSERLKEYEAARARYATLQAFSPRLEALAAIRLEQASLAARGGDRAAASALLAEAQTQNPDFETRRRMASLYRELGDDERARTILTGLASAAPGDPRLRIELAAVAAKTGDRAAALRFLGEARQRAPEAGDRRRMAYLHQELKDYGPALSLFDALVSEQPNDASLRGDLGLCRHLSGRTEDAITDLQTAIKLDPGLWPASLTLGAIYGAQARYDLAIGVYDSALREKNGRPAGLKELLSGGRAEAAKARGLKN